MFPWIYNTFGIHDDKVLHFGISVLITIGLLIVLKYVIKKSISTSTSYLGIFLFFLILSLCKEVWDSYNPPHSVELLDVITNLLGTSIVMIVDYLSNRRKTI